MHSEGPSSADKYIRDAHYLIDAKTDIRYCCRHILEYLQSLESYLKIDLPEHVREPKVAEIINKIKQEAGSIMFTINYHRTPKY